MGIRCGKIVAQEHTQVPLATKKCINLEYQEPGALLEISLHGEITIWWKNKFPDDATVSVAVGDENVEFFDVAGVHCTDIGADEVGHGFDWAFVLFKNFLGEFPSFHLFG